MNDKTLVSTWLEGVSGQNEIQEARAMWRAWKLEDEEGFNPRDVTQSKSKDDNGIDIRSDRGTIEVKGGRGKQMIPDAHGNEFDKEMNLIADYLYLVRFDEDGKEVGFYTLTREEVGNKHKPIRKMRFAPSLQTALKNGEFPNRLGD